MTTTQQYKAAEAAIERILRDLPEVAVIFPASSDRIRATMHHARRIILSTVRVREAGRD